MHKEPKPTFVSKAKRMLAGIADTAVEVVWPTRCAICDLPGDILCRKCLGRLRFSDTTQSCPKCGNPYGVIQCTECNDTTLGLSLRSSYPLDAISSAVCLDDASKRMITVFKDQDEMRLCGVIAEIMARYIDPEWSCLSQRESRSLTLTYIPATKEARRRRGFDHAQMIASEVAHISGMDLVCAFAPPKSSDQRKLGRSQRAQNMSNIIKVCQNTQVQGDYIVVDDICTTGSTLFAAADALKVSGARHVYGLTFGKVF